jgi:hypothetical protein
MAIPKDTEIPKSSGQFAKFELGKNKYRVLSDVVVGWEGWKNKKPFRHAGNVCKIKPEDVDLNQNGMPNINYFWAMVVWNYEEKKIQVLEITQKTIMKVLKELEDSEEWGDLKGYDITINKEKVGDKTTYQTISSPPKAITAEVKKALEETEVKLEKLFEGGYPIDTDESVDEDDIPPFI